MSPLRALRLLPLLVLLALPASAAGAFGPADRISTAAPDAADVDAATSSTGGGAVAWSQGDRVYVRRFAADGSFPDPPVDLSALGVDDPGTRSDVLPDVAVDENGAVHVAFLSTNTNGSDVDRRVLVASLDAGRSDFVVNRPSRFAQPVSEDPEELSRVRIAAGEAGRATVAWNTAAGRVLVATRPASVMGSTPAFAAPVELEDAGGSSVAVATGRLGGGPTTVAWANYGAQHFYGATRPQGASAFSAGQQVDDGDGSAFQAARGAPEVAVRETDGRSLVTYTQVESGTDNVFLASRLPGAADDYSAPTVLAPGGGDDFDPNIAAFGSHLIVAWASGNTSFRVFASRLDASAGVPSPGAAEELAPAGTQAANPSVDLGSGGQAVVAWNEFATNRVVARVATGPAAPYEPAQPLTAGGDTAGPGPAATLTSGAAPRATVAFPNTRGADGVQVYAASGPLADSSEVSFSQPSYTVAEGAGKLTVTLQRPAAGPAGSVRVRSTDGDAVAGADFTAVDQVIAFADGQTSAAFDVDITQDTTDEQTEPFTLALSEASGNAAPGDPASVQAFITDDDEPVAGAVSFATATLGAGESAGSRTITLTRPGGGPAGSVVVRAAGLSATAGEDFQALEATVDFAAGATQATTSLTVVDDQRLEEEETLRLTLDPSPGGPPIGSPAQAILTITDDDTPPSLSVDDVAVTEGDQAGFTVSLSKASGLPVTFRVVTEPGSAGTGDFTPIGADVEIVPGELTASVEVPTTEDAADEDAEAFALRATNVVGATVGKEAGTATVNDDDGSAPAPAPPGDTTTNPSAVAPISVTREELTMPNLLPRRAGRRYRFRTVTQATRRLEASGLNVRVDTRPVRAGEATTDAKLEEYLEDRGRGGEIVSQNPAPGAAVASTLTEPVTVRLSYYDPLEERRFRERIEREARERLERERVRIENERKERERVAAVKKCYLLGLNDGKDGGTPPTLTSIFGGRRFESLPKERIKDFSDIGAVDILTKFYKCEWEAKFQPVRGLVDSIVLDVRQERSRNLIELKVGVPVKPDFTLTFREDPTRLSGPDEVSLVEQPNGDWVLPANRGGNSVFTVQVNEIATGRFVPGATIEIYSGRTGKRIGTGRTDGNGEDWFRANLVEDTLTFIVRYPGANGRTAEGFRSLEVKNLGDSFTTICGRRIELRGGRHQGSRTELDRCKGFPLVPANLGTGAGSSPRELPRIQQAPVFQVDGTGATATAIGGEHNVIPIRPANTIVASAAGVIATGGGNLIGQAGGNRRSAVAQAAQLGNPFAAIGNLINTIVTPLVNAYNQGVANIRRSVTPAVAEQVRQTSQALTQAGAAVPPQAGLISDKGLGVISTGGGNLIGQAGGNVISTGGGNVISTGGGNLIGQAGGNVIATGGGNVMPVYGGRVISTGGLNR